MSNRGDSAGQETYHADLLKLRRSRYRKSVILPFACVLVLVLAYIGSALALPTPAQVAALSNGAFTLLVLCPAAVCLFPFTVAGIVLVALARRWQSGQPSPLRRLERLTAAIESKVERLLGGIDQRVLDWAVAFAPIRQLLKSFEALPKESRNESRNESLNEETHDEEEL